MTTGDYEPAPVTHDPVEKYRGFSEASIDWWCEACGDWVLADHRGHIYGYEMDGTPIYSAGRVGQLLGSNERIIARTQVGDAFVSTVFLVIDHGLGKVPVLWETMVFEGDEAVEDYTRRYTSAIAAKLGHNATVRTLQAKIGTHHE